MLLHYDGMYVHIPAEVGKCHAVVDICGDVVHHGISNLSGQEFDGTYLLFFSVFGLSNTFRSKIVIFCPCDVDSYVLLPQVDEYTHFHLVIVWIGLSLLVCVSLSHLHE